VNKVRSNGSSPSAGSQLRHNSHTGVR